MDNSAQNGNMDRNPAVIAVLEDQVAVLKSQLEWGRQEKVKLLDMLAMEQEKTKLLDCGIYPKRTLCYLCSIPSLYYIFSVIT